MKKIYWVLSALFVFVASCQQPEQVDSLNNASQLKEVIPKTVLTIARNFDAFVSVATSKDAPVNPPCQDSQIYVTLGTAAWGQQVSWNSQMPLDFSFGCMGMPNGRMLTGCVATAMAEIMNFHHFPNNFNWSEMGADKPETARLMRNAANSVNMMYDCGGSSAYASAIPSGLANGFGYSPGAIFASYNLSKIANDILNFGKPVILGGVYPNRGGHAWVCDGYYSIISCISSPAPMLNMNWGWDGNHNGFYTTDTGWDPIKEGSTFQNLSMVTNIKP